MDEIWINGNFSVQEPSELGLVFLAHLLVILAYFSLESTLIPGCFENELGQEFDSCHIAVKLEFDSIFQAVYEIWRWNVFYNILWQNDVLCGHSVVYFSVWFLQLTVSKYLVAGHVPEPGSLLTEPGAVIKLSHFSSRPDTCML